MTRTTETSQSNRDGVVPLDGLRVLVVEDHAIGRILLDAMLGGLGIAPVLTGTGEEAREAVHHQAFDAILVDLGLPDIRGERLAEELARLPNAKGAALIAVTGRERPLLLPEVFVDWLEKPFSVRDLHRLLREATERASRSA